MGFLISLGSVFHFSIARPLFAPNTGRDLRSSAILV
jgi:hypothetical protein